MNGVTALLYHPSSGRKIKTILYFLIIQLIDIRVNYTRPKEVAPKIAEVVLQRIERTMARGKVRFKQTR